VSVAGTVNEYCRQNLNVKTEVAGTPSLPWTVAYYKNGSQYNVQGVKWVNLAQ
jgi:hypothetical protein